MNVTGTSSLRFGRVIFHIACPPGGIQSTRARIQSTKQHKHQTTCVGYPKHQSTYPKHQTTRLVWSKAPNNTLVSKAPNNPRTYTKPQHPPPHTHTHACTRAHTHTHSACVLLRVCPSPPSVSLLIQVLLPSLIIATYMSCLYVRAYMPFLQVLLPSLIIATFYNPELMQASCRTFVRAIVHADARTQAHVRSFVNLYASPLAPSHTTHVCTACMKTPSREHAGKYTPASWMCLCTLTNAHMHVTLLTNR
jgi:hypothetical protein